jgi:hypothetical protein
MALTREPESCWGGAADELICNGARTRNHARVLFRVRLRLPVGGGGGSGATEISPD